MKTTHTIWEILDEKVALEPFTCRQTHIKDGILFETSEDTEDGTYPRVCDYMRFANSLDREGTSYFLNRLTRKKNKLQERATGILQQS
jgi:hypothetical protein